MSFWNLTLPELFAMFDAHAIRQRRTYEVATLTAWQTANLMRADPKKRLPALKKLFDQFGDKDKPQTIREMKGVLMQFAAAHGLKFQVAAHG